MVNLVLEIVGIVLIVAALAVLAVVAGSWRWEAGAAVGAVEAGIVGAVLIVVANRQAKPRPQP